MRDITCLVIHHSASSGGNAHVFGEEHKRKGWSQIGYHDVITNGNGGPDGVIQAGRPHEITGAGVYGRNRGQLHVCLVGNFHKGDKHYTGLPTKKQMHALGHWLLANQKRYGLANGVRLPVKGHKEAALMTHPTACPGNQFPLLMVRDWLDLNIAKARHTEITAIPSLTDFLEENEFWDHH